MKVFDLPSALSEWLDIRRIRGYSIGFVPTMGALHSGHLSLIQAANKNNDISVCSVFVNPTQFNSSSDLDRYPRTVQADLDLLEEANCAVVLTPSVQAIYPSEIPKPALNYGLISSSLEATFRPGHFEGMIQVVSRLLDIVNPDEAYFGEKDFQQLALVTAYCAEHYPATRIVPCPIIREASGLAMSSRNELLSTKNRKKAARLYAGLKSAFEVSLSGTPAETVHHLENFLKKEAGFKIEYIALVNPVNFQPVTDWEEDNGARLLLAVWLEGIRLIDNFQMRVSAPQNQSEAPTL